jgi:streptomycin 6-kinase
MSVIPDDFVRKASAFHGEEGLAWFDQLAEVLDLDRARVRDWAMAQAVLSVWWTIEDNGDVSEDALTCAELLAAIKRWVEQTYRPL